jgi:hypothetical protein
VFFNKNPKFGSSLAARFLPFGPNISTKRPFSVDSVEKFLLHASFSAWHALRHGKRQTIMDAAMCDKRWLPEELKSFSIVLNNYFINQK